MRRILAAIGIAILASACSYFPAGPSTAFNTAAPEPECLQASPGNSLPGFRCTGDYTGSGGTNNSGR